MHEHLNDDEAERFLSGEADGDPLSATLESMRHHFDSVTPPTPSDALSEFLSVDLVAEFTDSTPPTSPTIKDRTKMSLSAFVGTAAGKILIGTTVAAASVGGAQATGVVDLPLLPDVDDQSVVEVDVADIGDDTVIEVATPVTDELPPAPAASSSDSLADDSDSDDSVSDSDESDDTNLVIAARTFDVLDVGTVTIQSDAVNGLTVVDTTTTDGWTVEIDNDSDSSDDDDDDDESDNDESHEVEVTFRNGDDRVDFKAEVEDGALRIRIRDRRTDTVEELWFDENGNPIADPGSDDTNLVIAARTFDVLAVGTVTIQSDAVNGLTVVNTTTIDGWTVEIDNDSDSSDDDESHEVEVTFRNGDDRVDFKAEVEDGALRIRIRDRRTDTVGELWFDENGNPIADPDSDDESDDDESDDNGSDDDSDDSDSDDDSDHDSDDDSSDDDSDDDSSDDDSSDDDSDDDDSGDDDSDDD
jgi:hypothetical protein